MNINFTSNAEEYLQNILRDKHLEDYRFILDYTDGQSPYNDDMIGCHCQDYTKYRLLIILKNDKNEEFLLFLVFMLLINLFENILYYVFMNFILIFLFSYSL